MSTLIPPASVPLLGDVRVIDVSSCIAGAYASKMFADAGADVIKIESRAGDPLRQWSATQADLGGSDGAFFRFLNASKRSVVADVGSDEAGALFESADLVIDDHAPDGELDRVLDSSQGLVRLSITPYGRTGPWARRPATEFVVQAESGSGARRGLLSHPPYQVAGRMTEFVAGVYGATGAIAALRGSRMTGRGEHVDVSWLESITLAACMFSDLAHRLGGRPPITAPARWVELPSIEPTADGWVGFNTNSRQQYDDFLVLIGQSDLADRDELADFRVRQLHADRWNELVHSYTMAHTTADIVETAQAFRIPVAPVNSGRTVLSDVHLRARGSFVRSPEGDFEHPRPPYQFDEQPLLPRAPAPLLGEHTGAVEPRRPRRREEPTDGPTLPLAGVRILDCTAWWAGPSSTVVLAALGADVIHVESTKRPDGSRLSGTMWASPDMDWWECSSMFLSSNTNKRDITLDLSGEAGMEAMKRLIGTADVVVENFSPRVFEQFGLGWDQFHPINPRAFLVRMPAFGLSGPWRDAVGFAQTMEQMTGLAWITGHAADQSRIPQGPCDPLAGMHAAFAIVAGLEERERTGLGRLIEVAMVEGALNAAAESIVEWSCYGNEMTREGNRSPRAAPQNLYATAEHERWLAISCESDAHWEALCGVLNDPDWAGDQRFATHHGRRLHHDDLDAHLGAWAAELEIDEAVDRLIGAGVPAGEARDPRLYGDHPQHVARAFHEELVHPVVGRQPFIRPPFRFASVDRWLRSPAPLFGADNRVVLAEVGYDDAEIDQMERDGVIGTRPKGT